MNNLIIITGATCMGKTPLAVELSERFGWYLIHTDWYYHPLKGVQPKTPIGVNSISKRAFIRQFIPYTTDTTIIEGIHIGNARELAIFKRYLKFGGNVYIFKVESDRFEEWFLEKYPEVGLQGTQKELDRFKEISDLEPDAVVSTADEVINFLQEKNVCIPG